MVLAIRLNLYARSRDGTYTVEAKGDKNAEPKTKIASSRIMIATVKMKYFRLRGRGADGDEDEETDEITICNAHLHARTAKRDLNEGGRAYSLFCNDVAA